MATCGYEDIRDFQRAEVMVAPALQTEGKQLQRQQSVGMGSNGRARSRPESPSRMTERRGRGRGRTDRGQRPRQEVPARRSRGGAPQTAHEEVLVLDFGGQYSQLIARRIRECGVFAELLPHDLDLDADPRALAARPWCSPAGPPPSTPRARRALRRELLELGIPVLGICYGMQAMVLALGGRVEGAEAGEFGRTELTLAGDGGRLLAGLPPEQQCWMSHRDCVFEAPAGLHRARVEPRLAGRRARGRRPRPLRDPVPPRGRPHALRAADPRALPARDRRLRGALVAGVGDRRAGRADPRRRSATPGSSAGSRAGSTRRPRRRSSTARSATSSPACSSTTA